MPPMTLPNMIPTRGTITTSLKRMCWMNQTKIQVPRIAKTKAKAALPMSVEPGMNSRASRMPNCAEEMVAPVVGETNLFMHSCCMISPATLIPTPVQRMARSLGSREIRKISSCSRSPASRAANWMSITPTNRERTDRIARTIARITVKVHFLMKFPPSFGHEALARAAACGRRIRCERMAGHSFCKILDETN